MYIRILENSIAVVCTNVRVQPGSFIKCQNIQIG